MNTERKIFKICEYLNLLLPEVEDGNEEEMKDITWADVKATPGLNDKHIFDSVKYRREEKRNFFGDIVYVWKAQVKVFFYKEEEDYEYKKRLEYEEEQERAEYERLKAKYGNS